MISEQFVRQLERRVEAVEQELAAFRQAVEAALSIFADNLASDEDRPLWEPTEQMGQS